MTNAQQTVVALSLLAAACQGARRDAVSRPPPSTEAPPRAHASGGATAVARTSVRCEGHWQLQSAPLQMPVWGADEEDARDRMEELGRLLGAQLLVVTHGVPAMFDEALPPAALPRPSTTVTACEPLAPSQDPVQLETARRRRCLRRFALSLATAFGAFSHAAASDRPRLMTEEALETWTASRGCWQSAPNEPDGARGDSSGAPTRCATREPANAGEESPLDVAVGWSRRRGLARAREEAQTLATADLLRMGAASMTGAPPGDGRYGQLGRALLRLQRLREHEDAWTDCGTAPEALSVEAFRAACPPLRRAPEAALREASCEDLSEALSQLMSEVRDVSSDPDERRALARDGLREQVSCLRACRRLRAPSP